MNRAIFLDVDGTLTETLTGATFKQNSKDIKVIAGVAEALKYYENQIPKWVMVGISNQGGCSAVNPQTGNPYKSIEDAIAEMSFTLELLPQLQAVYFCPDEKGLICWRVTSDGAVKLFDGTDDEIEIPPELRYSKPGAGMIHQAVTDFGIDLTQSWLVGDDEQYAAAMAINFMDSETWCDRFRPGMYEVKPVTIEQVKFLESLRFKNDNN